MDALKVLNDARRGLFLQFFSQEDVDTTSLRRVWQRVRAALLEAKRNGAILPEWVRAALKLWHWKEARRILLEYIEDKDYQALDRFLQKQKDTARAQAISNTMFKFYNKSRLIEKKDAAASPVVAAQVNVAVQAEKVRETQVEAERAQVEAAKIIEETAKTMTLDEYITGLCGQGEHEKRRISDNNYVCQKGQTCAKGWCKTEKSGSKYGVATGYWDVCTNTEEYTTCEKDGDIIAIKKVNEIMKTLPYNEQRIAKGLTSPELTALTDQIAILLNQKESMRSLFSNVENPTPEAIQAHTGKMEKLDAKMTTLKKSQSELLKSTRNSLDAILERIQAAVLIWEKKKALDEEQLKKADKKRAPKYELEIQQSEKNIALLQKKLEKYADLSESLKNPEIIFCADDPEERFISEKGYICQADATCEAGLLGTKWCRTEDYKGARSLAIPYVHDTCDSAKGKKRVCKKFNKFDELEYAEIPSKEELQTRYTKQFGLEEPKD